MTHAPEEITALARASISAEKQWNLDRRNRSWAANALGTSTAYHNVASPQAWIAQADRIKALQADLASAREALKPITELEIEELRNNEAIDSSAFEYVTVCLERPQREETGVVGSRELARIYNAITQARAALKAMKGRSHEQV